MSIAPENTQSQYNLNKFLSRIPQDILAGLVSLVLIMIGLWSFNFTWYGDDSVYYNAATAGRLGPLWGALVSYYFNHTTRVLPMAALRLLVLQPGLWRVITALLISTICIVPSIYLARSPRSRAALILAATTLMAAVPALLLFEIGYIMTSVVYLWTWAAGIIAFYPAVAYLRGWRLRPPLVAISVLFLIYAINSELVAAFLFAGFIAVAVYKRTQKSRFAALIPFAVAAFGGLLFSVTAPGNAVRFQAELHHFPGYEDLTLLGRLEIGYSATLRAMFMNGYIPILAFLVAVLAVVIYRRNNLARIAIAALPIIGWLLLSTQGGLFWWPINQGSEWPFAAGTGQSVITIHPNQPATPVANNWLPFRFVTAFHQDGLVRLDDPFSVFVALALTTLLALTVLSVFWALGNSVRFYGVALVAALAMATKFVLAFSPTVWASGSRTDIMLILGFNLATLILFEPVLSELVSRRAAPAASEPALTELEPA